MPARKIVPLAIALIVITGGLAVASGVKQSTQEEVHRWRIHDPDRPLPPVVDPGRIETEGPITPPPSDAIVLFDGTDLSGWRSKREGPAGWKVENGYMEVTRGGGSIITVQEFGDCQLHVEFAMPDPPAREGQNRGNSGVFLMDIYEVQVLDSYENTTYADGMAASLYGQYPPMVNACRPPGEWQTYDIVFHGPRFDSGGELLSPARFTVFHNGILVHDNAELTGPTVYRRRPPYEAHPDRLPISLQDHGQPVRFRNIWIRELP